MPRTAFPSGRKSLLLLALAAIIIGGAWWWQGPPPEPVHDGQRLSEWLARRDRNNALTAEAVRAFGPGTIPWLAYTAEHGQHRLKRQGPPPLASAPGWLRRWFSEEWGGFQHSSSQDDRRTALHALAVLGPEAAPAIPALVRILGHASDVDHCLLADPAARALNAIGAASWPAVEQTLAHGNWQARSALLSTIELRVGTREQPAPEAEMAKVVAIFGQACGDPNPKFRALATAGLRSCGRQRPDLLDLDSFRDEAIRLLSNPDTSVREQALKILGDTNNNKAARIIPRLIEFLDDPNDYIRSSAARALGNFDRDEKLSAPRLRAMFRDDPNADCREEAGLALKDLRLPQDEVGSRAEASSEK